MRFNYATETWEAGTYDLPFYRGDYVVLTPKDILTKDDNWISHVDLVHDFTGIIDAIPNGALREQLNNYFLKILPEKANRIELTRAVSMAVAKFPEVLDYFIKGREERGTRAKSIAQERVRRTERLLVTQVHDFALARLQPDGFFRMPSASYQEVKARVDYLKHVIENQDGWRIFYVDGQPIGTEKDLHILFKLCWFGTEFDVNSEVNNGRGPVDFKVSKGSADKSLVEFKLAKNSHLKKNLANQVAVYEKANQTSDSIKVILYFTYQQLEKLNSILKELGLEEDPSIVLIDARADNKPSASKA